MKTWLIQRGRFETREKVGIDNLVRFDYMGYAEFEFGALPESLASIRSCINEYIYLDVPIKDKVITVFCKDSQKTDVKTYLEELAEDKMRLKSYSEFNSYINGDKFLPSRTDFWWDIENNLMFWRKNVEFETNFKAIIATAPY